MTAPAQSRLDEQITTALDACIGKMADHLRKTFDPQDADSLKLFKQFCSALNARRQWLKCLEEGGEKRDEIRERLQQNLAKKPMKDFVEPGWTGNMLQRTNPHHPLKPEHLNNGLVCKR